MNNIIFEFSKFTKHFCEANSKKSRSENNSNEHKMAIEDRQTFEIGNYSLSFATLR